MQEPIILSRCPSCTMGISVITFSSKDFMGGWDGWANLPKPRSSTLRNHVLIYLFAESKERWFSCIFLAFFLIYLDLFKSLSRKITWIQIWYLSEQVKYSLLFFFVQGGRGFPHIKMIIEVWGSCGFCETVRLAWRTSAVGESKKDWHCFFWRDERLSSL